VKIKENGSGGKHRGCARGMGWFQGVSLMGKVPFFISQWAFGARVYPLGFEKNIRLFGSKIFPAVWF
jgi:hypothetical protein